MFSIVRIGKRVTYNKVYVGWDSTQEVAYEILKYSLLKKSSNIEVIPIKQHQLRTRSIYNRPVDPLSSTEFTFTRFLVPYLQNYKEWALFMDCDMLPLVDINALFDQVDEKYALMCTQHDYIPSKKIKMDSKQQEYYPRKNWSSLVLFNCNHPSNKVLNRDLVNNLNLSGKFFHRFGWLKDEEIGKLSHEFNWLVNWYKEPEDGTPKILHFTEGGPWLDKYNKEQYADIWFNELDLYNKDKK
jgi:lipopolysaccharide biosynthesis glycosyltransferase